MFRILQMCNKHFSNKDSTLKDLFELNVKILKLFVPKLLSSSKMGSVIVGFRKVSNNLTDNCNENSNTDYNDNNVAASAVPVGSLIAFADVSLQTCDGSLDALYDSPLLTRFKLYNLPFDIDTNRPLKLLSVNRRRLQPYICNVLVTPEYRNKGFGSRLIAMCENEAKNLTLPILDSAYVESISSLSSSITKKTIDVTSADTFSPVVTFSTPIQEKWSYIHLHVDFAESAAINMYRKVGFEEVSTLKNRSEKGDVVFMRKKIKYEQ
jgi:GNAT superfamily N-acetyltransferase